MCGSNCTEGSNPSLSANFFILGFMSSIASALFLLSVNRSGLAIPFILQKGLQAIAPVEMPTHNRARDLRLQGLPGGTNGPQTRDDMSSLSAALDQEAPRQNVFPPDYRRGHAARV